MNTIIFSKIIKNTIVFVNLVKYRKDTIIFPSVVTQEKRPEAVAIRTAWTKLKG